MHIEDLFEDLEAQFSAANAKVFKPNFYEQARVLEVSLAGNLKRSLIAPILGCDFVAGLDPVSPVWFLHPLQHIRKLRITDSAEPDLPNLRQFEVGLAKFLQSIPQPCSVRWRTTIDDHLAIGQLHTVTNSLLFIYQAGSTRPVAVPINALELLIIEAVDNLNGSF